MVTLPLLAVTVREWVFMAKFAVTDLSSSIVRVQVGLVPEQSPDQLVKS